MSWYYLKALEGEEPYCHWYGLPAKDEPIKDSEDDYEYEPGKLPFCAKGGSACSRCKKEGTTDCTFIKAILRK